MHFEEKMARKSRAGKILGTVGAVSIALATGVAIASTKAGKRWDGKMDWSEEARNRRKRNKKRS